MKVLLHRVGRGRTPWADAAVEDYQRRLARQLDFAEQLDRPEPFKGDVDRVRAAEGARLLAGIREGDRLIPLDERGEQVTTELFSSWIEEAARGSARRIVLAIGGPYGHPPEVRKAAWKVLGLSRMVLNHELARVLIVEQLYRAGSLLWGGAYHHGGAELPER